MDTPEHSSTLAGFVCKDTRLDLLLWKISFLCFKDCFSNIKSKAGQMGFQQVQTLQEAEVTAFCQIMAQAGVKELSKPFSSLEIWFYALGLIVRSRMSREVHVRFCERLRGEIPLCLLYYYSLFSYSIFLKKRPVINTTINKIKCKPNTIIGCGANIIEKLTKQEKRLKTKKFHFF